MDKGVVVTDKYVKQIAAKIFKAPEGSTLTMHEALYIIFCHSHKGAKQCFVSGSKLVMNCGNDECVNPDHVEIIPPTTH